MNRLKTILQYDSSKFIHLAIVASLCALTKTSYLVIILILVELVVLFFSSKNLLIYSFIIMGVIFFRYEILDNFNDINCGLVVEVDEGSIVIKNDKLAILYLKDTSKIEVGMYIEFDGDLVERDQYNLPGGFDYSSYLKSKYIFSEYYIKNIRIVEKRFNLFEVKEVIKQKINDNYFKKDSSYLNLFILGEKSGMDEEIMSKSSRIGVSHLFAISGMHLSLIVGFIGYILERFYLRKNIKNIILSVFLLTYNIITGFMTSILRASLLTIAIFFDKKKTFTSSDYLSFILISFIIYNPYSIYNIGFVLSFLISFSIILGRNFFVNDRKYIQIFKIGCLSNLIALPIIVNLNNEIGLLNVFYNVFFVYFVSLIFLPLSFFLLVFKKIEIMYSTVIYIFETILDITSRSNIYLHFSFSNEIFVGLYWLVLLSFFIKYNNPVKRKAIIFVITILIIINTYLVPLTKTYVRLLDVNQGESFHLHSGTCDILIDTGDRDDYDNLINYLKHENIKDLDYLFVTHMHEDHYGELGDILEKVNVKEVVMNSELGIDGVYPSIVMNEGDIINCGGFRILNLNGNISENENDNSLVLYFKVFDDSWLITGDIEKEIEMRLLENYILDIDVLQVPHHGSITSSTEEFINNLSPKYALIPVGKNNYNHPDQEVINRLIRANSIVLDTHHDGTITFNYYPLFDLSIIDTCFLGRRDKYWINI